MDLQRLEQYLYEETPSEKWHLIHPGVLSPFYDTLEKRRLGDQEYYYFDFHNTLKTELFGIVRETRYTTIPAHFHKDMELNYIYSGSCTFFMNGRTIRMEEGDLCILDSNVVHSAVSVKSSEDIVINVIFKKEYFDHVFLSRLSSKGIVVDFLLDMLSKSRDHDKYLLFHTKNNFKVHLLIQFLLVEYFFPSQCRHELIQQYSGALFTELISTSCIEPGLYTSQDGLLRILKYIERNFQRCSLSDTAAHFGYNANYLSNYLKVKIGKTFTEIKLSQQMMQSARLLEGTDMTIEEIVDYVGCSNISFFYKKFQDTYQTTPKGYRLAHRIQVKTASQ